MIIDVSIPLDNDTPAYPGNPKIQITQTESFKPDGYLGHSVLLGTHTGTHVDAPAHMIDGAPTLGQLPIETFTGQGRVAAGFSVHALEAAGAGAGDMVLFHTGTSARLHDPSYFTDYPVMPDEVADWLVARGVKAVGLDTCSADNAPGFPVHKKLLGAGIPIIENLTNLEALRDKDFELFALPLKLDTDGAPARVFAVVRE